MPPYFFFLFSSALNLEIERGEKIAFVAVCEHEYSYALEDRMGSRPFDEFETMDDIRKGRKHMAIDRSLASGSTMMLIMKLLESKDMYGYELVEEVSKVVDVNEGTIYPLLKRLTNEKYFETYLRESTEGPPRKYYTITDIGREALKELQLSWNEISNTVNHITNL